MLAMLAASPSIGATPLRRTATTKSAAGGPKKAMRYHCGPTRTCRTCLKSRPADPGPSTILRDDERHEREEHDAEQPEGIQRDVRLEDPEALVAQQ